MIHSSAYNPQLNDVFTKMSEYPLQHSVHHWVKSFVRDWGDMITPIHPREFLSCRLLQHEPDKISHANIKLQRRPPSVKQLQDYDNELLMAVRNSDITTLDSLHNAGKCMSACNRFGESILHMACRRSSPETVQYLLANGANAMQIDDFGRNALHDACWRAEPNFDIVALLMNACPDLINHCEKHGATPLDYVQKEYWVHWCAFLFLQKDKYWPSRGADGCN